MILGLGRSPGGGHGNLLQYSCQEKIPWTEEPGGLWGRRESDTTERLSLQELNKKLPILSSHAKQTVPFTT